MEELDDAIGRLPEREFLILQVNVLAMAVKALIETHPDKELCRKVIEEFAAQRQASPALLSAHQDVRAAFRAYLQELLS